MTHTFGRIMCFHSTAFAKPKCLIVTDGKTLNYLSKCHKFACFADSTVSSFLENMCQRL